MRLTPVGIGAARAGGKRFPFDPFPATMQFFGPHGPGEGVVMISGSVVFYKIASTCLIIFVGFLARRMKLLPENSLSVMSRFTMNVALPAYIVFYMPSTISMETLSRHWFFPVLGAFLIFASDMFGYGCAKIWSDGGGIGTFRMLVGFPNWMFMALAVCEPLFGDDGIRMVLLYNLGIMTYLWSFGMTSFRPGIGFWDTVKHLVLNIQMMANIVGVAIALFFPVFRGMEQLGSAELAAMPLHLGLLTPIWETVYFLGMTALPMSIFQIGVLLGAPSAATPEEKRRDNRDLAIVSALRLLAAPLISIGMLAALVKLGVSLTFNEFVISAIVMAMPAAVLCVTATETYGGRSRLAARGILWTTIASLGTAPVLTWVAQAVYAWL